MPATPKSLRQPPPRNFEDYSVTYETSPELGLFPLRNEEMEYAPGPAGGSGGYNQKSLQFDIGFLLNFCGTDCDKVTVSTYGWCALTQPGVSYSDSSFFSGGTYQDPRRIFLNAMGAGLLAPWFSEGIQNTYRYVDAAVAGTHLTSDEGELLKSGRVTIAPEKQRWIDSSAGGIKIHRGTCSLGRYLLVRWHSMGEDTNDIKSTLKFDLVVYENGTIEYRYAPIDLLISTDVPQRTAVGVWLPQANQTYRDFSNYLKADNPLTPGTERSQYRYGGTVYNGTYLDSVTVPRPPYSVSLNHTVYWPAKGNNGAIFRFSPPVNKRRNNRRTITARDSKPISPAGTFDDRKTTYFVADTVSYPAGLPVNRPYTTSYRGVHSTLDLFSLGDLELVRTGSGGMYDQVLEETPIDQSEDGFREVALHEQGNLADDFFSSGSLIQYGHEPGDFSSALDKKSIIRMTLPVKTTTQLLGTSSCVYYYNRSFSRWSMPTGSYGDVCNAFDKFSFNTDWPTQHGTGAQPYTVGSLIPEDIKGFNSYGRPVASGSNDVHRKVEDATGQFNQTISWLGNNNTTNEQALSAISDPQPKSVNQSSNYTASSDELIEIPIDRPFLLEKAVLDFSIEAGLGWFNDRTTTTSMFVDSLWDLDPTDTSLYVALDQGGPVVTAALFCRKKVAGRWIMDLICSGTITHTNDTQDASTLKAKAYKIDEDLVTDPRVSGNCVIVSQNGFDYANAVVSSEGSQFTGSVKINMTPMISNGVDACHVKTFLVNTSPTPPAVTPAEAVEWFRTLVTGSMYEYDSSNYGEELRTTSINPLGRSMQGFTPGGSSIFGSENITYGSRMGDRCTFPSPFYTPSLSLADATFTHVSSTIVFQANEYVGTDIAVIFTSNITFNGNKIAPYLLQPEDKLILSIFKTRPAYNHVKGIIPDAAAADVGKRNNTDDCLKLDYDNFAVPSNFLSVTPHDIKLSTGSINMSLYGSYVAANRGRS